MKKSTKVVIKKGLSVALSGILAMAAVIGTAFMGKPERKAAAAEETITLYAAEAECEGLADSTEKTDHALYEYYGYVSLKPETEGGIGRINFSLDIEKAGEYRVEVIYTAKDGSAARKMAYGLNGGLTDTVLETEADWDTTISFTKTYDFEAQTYTFTLATPSDYDNSNVKTPNIYAVRYTLVSAREEAAAETTKTEEKSQTETDIDTVSESATATQNETVSAETADTGSNETTAVAAATSVNASNAVSSTADETSSPATAIVLVIVIVLAAAACTIFILKKKKAN